MPAGHPVEFLSLSGKLGAEVRATVHSFGPMLLGKVLELNDTQTSILSMIFKYCDDTQLPLLDLKDLQAVLKFLSSDEGKPVLADYGGMSPASVGVLLRSIIMLEQSGADIFFGEPEFDVNDLLRATPDGKGVVSVLELSDVMDRPKLFSTFMLWMLAQLYHALPEVGDLPQPKLAFFFDEAHLLFADASQALLDQIEQTVRLIRSKGVGVFFSTQAPTDIPPAILAQLGNRIEHALRAFTPQDADNLRKTARTYPDLDVLRRREGDHLTRDRRGAGHGPLAARRADAAGGDPPGAARLPVRGTRFGPLPGVGGLGLAAAEVRHDHRSAERLRDGHGPDPGRPGRCGPGRGAGWHPGRWRSGRRSHGDAGPGHDDPGRVQPPGSRSGARGCGGPEGCRPGPARPAARPGPGRGRPEARGDADPTQWHQTGHIECRTVADPGRLRDPLRQALTRTPASLAIDPLPQARPPRVGAPSVLARSRIFGLGLVRRPSGP